MYFMLVCDIGEIVPVYEFRPVTGKDGKLPLNAIEGGYLRTDSQAFRPRKNADGSITPAEETEAYKAFAAEGLYHEYSPISSMTHFDDDDESDIDMDENFDDEAITDPELDLVIYGTRYFEDSAFFVDFESVDDLMLFMGKYNQDLNYEIGREYSDGTWSGTAIPYLVIDITLLEGYE